MSWPQFCILLFCLYNSATTPFIASTKSVIRSRLTVKKEPEPGSIFGIGGGVTMVGGATRVDGTTVTTVGASGAELGRIFGRIFLFSN